MLESSYIGVDYSIPGNGGPDCYNSISIKQRVVETCVYTVGILLLFGPPVYPFFKKWRAQQPVSDKDDCAKSKGYQPSITQKFLLVILCVVFGVEFGYKIATQRYIYLLNPCHVLTIVQIYLLSAEPSPVSASVFRVHIHLLFCGILAILFPVLNTRKLPGEIFIYWLQHILVTFVVPPYLFHLGGAYKQEPLQDLVWMSLSVLIFGFYMFYWLQSLAMISLVNLNNMLCPAVSDPFKGPYYRWYAMVYLTLLNMVFGKIYTVIVTSLLELVTRLRHSYQKKEAANSHQKDA